MAEQKTDISKLVLNANKAERKNLKSILEAMEREEIRKSNSKPKVLKEIQNYEDPRVEMYSPKAVYDVTNTVTRTNFYLNGAQVASLLIGNSKDYENILKKRQSPEISVNGMHINFKHFEVEE